MNPKDTKWKWRSLLNNELCDLYVDSCKHSNEPSGSVRRGEFLDYMRNY